MRIDDECAVKELAGRRLVLRPPEHMVRFCHPVLRGPKGPGSRTVLLRESLPRKYRRVGADRNQSRADRAEQRQVSLVSEELPGAKIAVGVIENHDHRTVRQQFVQFPGFAVEVVQLEVGRVPAKSGWLWLGMRTGWARIS